MFMFPNENDVIKNRKKKKRNLKRHEMMELMYHLTIEKWKNEEQSEEENASVKRIELRKNAM